MLVPQTKVGVVSSAPSSSPSSEEGSGSSVDSGVPGSPPPPPPPPPRPFLPLDLATEGRDVGGVELDDARREGGGGGVANCVGVEDLPRRRR